MDDAPCTRRIGTPCTHATQIRAAFGTEVLVGHLINEAIGK